MGSLETIQASGSDRRTQMKESTLRCSSWYQKPMMKMEVTASATKTPATPSG